MLRSLMNGEQTLAMASYMLDRCRERAVLTCYTFDSMEVAISLTNAAKRGRRVTVYADRNHLISALPSVRSTAWSTYGTAALAPAS